jgi:hypothetical protein
MSRRITENTDRHITVRQLESTVRLAQGRKTNFFLIEFIYFVKIFSTCKIDFFETSQYS